LLSLYKSNQISDDGARLTRVVRRVGNDRGAIRARQFCCTSQMFGFGGVERLARDVAVSGGVHFGVEITQPHVYPKKREAERAVAAARIERNLRQIEP
jgi:hypothetical protein